MPSLYICRYNLLYFNMFKDYVISMCCSEAKLSLLFLSTTRIQYSLFNKHFLSSYYMVDTDRYGGYKKIQT